MIEEAIYARLQAVAAVTAIVPATRMYYLTLADNPEYPAISYQRLNTSREYVVGDTVTMTEITLQVDCWSLSDLEAMTLGNEVRKALDGYQGTVSGVRIERIFQTNEMDLKELEGTVYRRYQTFRVIFQEAS